MVLINRFVMDRLMRRRNFFFFEVFFEMNVKIVMRLVIMMIKVLVLNVMNYGCREILVVLGKEVELFRL